VSDHEHKSVSDHEHKSVIDHENERVRIEQVIEQAYRALAFEPGQEPDWVNFQQTFATRAVLALRVFPEDPEVRIMDLEGYAHEQMRNDLKHQGYSETPGERKVEIIGDVAAVRQEFTMNFADRSQRAVDLFCLARTQGDWLIVSVVSDVIRDGSS